MKLKARTDLRRSYLPYFSPRHIRNLFLESLPPSIPAFAPVEDSEGRIRVLPRNGLMRCGVAHDYPVGGVRPTLSDEERPDPVRTDRALEPPSASV